MTEGRKNQRRANKTARLNTITARLLSPAFRARGITMGRIVTEWPKIAGPYAAWCDPIAIQFPKGKSSNGTLTLAVTPGRGPEIQMQVQEIIRNCNAVFGYGALARITLTQGVHDARRSPPPSQPRRRITPEDAENVAEAAAAMGQIRDDDLRKALDNLGKSLSGSTVSDKK